jgi:hypothetical protein
MLTSPSNRCRASTGVDLSHVALRAAKEIMIQPEAPYDSSRLAVEFAELNDYLYASGDERSALQRLVHLAVSSVPGCASAAVSSWSANQRPRTLASTDDTALAVNDVQHRLGQGPCLTAAVKSEIVRLPDLSEDQRWPAFTAKVMVKTPVRGVLSFHLVDQPVPSALSAFSTQAGVFDSYALDIATVFAAHARVLLTHAASASRVANLETALRSSRQIGAAIGILMTVHKVPEEQAYALLRRSSNHLNRKLHDIANDVTQTGALPGPS